MGRPRTVNIIPFGLEIGQPVKITCTQYKKPKLGLIREKCKYDGGIIVWLTAETKNGINKYVCIQVEKGDTIQGI